MTTATATANDNCGNATTTTTATADPYGMTNKGTNNGTNKGTNNRNSNGNGRSGGLDGCDRDCFAGLQEAEQVLVVDIFLAVGEFGEAVVDLVELFAG